MNINDCRPYEGFHCDNCLNDLHVAQYQTDANGDVIGRNGIEPSYCPVCGEALDFANAATCEMCHRKLRPIDDSKGGTYSRPCWQDGTESFELCGSCADKVQRFIVHYGDTDRDAVFWE